MRALPHVYRDVNAPIGTLISVRVDGPAADDWQLYRSEGGWLLCEGSADTPATVITLPGDIAWRMFTKGIPRAELERRVTIAGERSLARHALNAFAIVA